MSKKIIPFILASVCLISGVAHAQKPILNANNQVSFLVGNHDLSYWEEDRTRKTGTDTFDRENGGQLATSFSITSQGELGSLKNVYFNAEYLGANGKTAYDGYLQGNGKYTPYQSQSNTKVDQFSVRLGKALVVAPDLQITPFVGLGTRNWVRDSSSDPHGYLETYHHQFYEAGVLAQKAFTKKLVGSASVGFGDVFGATLDVPKFTSSTFDLGTAPITTLKIGLDYALDYQWHLLANYTKSDFSYQESPVIGNMREPHSTTTTRSFFVGFGLAF
jgi:hypothetical protein